MNPNRPLIMEIADQLQAWGLYTNNVDMFIGKLPQSIESGLLLIDAPGPEPHRYIDTEKHVIDFWYRSPHTDQAYYKMQELFRTFARRSNYPLVNWYVYESNPLGDIVDAGSDLENGKLLRLGVQFLCRNLNNIS